jgi:hypothetical protein
MRTTRALTGTAATVAVAGWILTTGASYTLVSHLAHMRPVTAVTTARPEVGVLIDAPTNAVPKLAGELASRGIHVSFAINRAFPPAAVSAYGDQAVPRLPTGGLVRWLKARAELHRLMRELGYGRHFLYASSGPSVGQWLVAHGAGGRLVAGAVKLDDLGDHTGVIRPGEVVELSMTSASEIQRLADDLAARLASEHLTAVPVGRLMRDAGVSA